ncbi:hypothetical protein RRSWK_04611 [Rhodopirellula sp. SWK7]|nr:hypothetical protein RRSWK_04611 [Rhodopirellula sp. SWK7]
MNSLEPRIFADLLIAPLPESGRNASAGPSGQFKIHGTESFLKTRNRSVD